MLHGSTDVLRAHQDWKIRLLQQVYDRSICLGVDTPSSPGFASFSRSRSLQISTRDYTHRYEIPRIVKTSAFAPLPIALASSRFVTVPSESPLHRQTVKTSSYSHHLPTPLLPTVVLIPPRTLSSPFTPFVNALRVPRRVSSLAYSVPLSVAATALDVVIRSPACLPLPSLGCQSGEPGPTTYLNISETLNT